MKAAHVSWTLLFVVLLASSIGAQGHHGGGLAPGPTSPPIVLPMRPILTPTTIPSNGRSTSVPKAPPITLPMRPIVTPSTVTGNGQARDIFFAHRYTYAPRFDRVSRVPLGYFGGGYFASDGVDTRVADPGYVEFDVQPANAQVFLDGLYLGDASTLRREGGRRLDAGAHHLDVRSDGYESASVDLRIDPLDTTVYRTQLKPNPAPPSAATASIPAKPKTFYVIAGCYAGDTRPEPRQLPPGCDPAKVRVVPPVVSRVDAQRPGV